VGAGAFFTSPSILRTSPGKIRSEVKLLSDFTSSTVLPASEERLQSVSPESTVISDADMLAAATADKAVRDAAEIIVFFIIFFPPQFRNMYLMHNSSFPRVLL